MDKILYTGAFNLRNQEPERRFGLIGAYGPTDASGTLRVTLDKTMVSVQEEQDDFTLELPEVLVKEIALKMLSTVARLEQLHELLRLGKLSDDSLYDASDLSAE